jgi:hypothetical protein
VNGFAIKFQAQALRIRTGSVPLEAKIDGSVFCTGGRPGTCAEQPEPFQVSLKKMIAFRNSHPSLCRGRFWREDISWYGAGPTVDFSPDSRSLAFCLHGASQADDDIYVMINAFWQELQVQIQEGAPQDWLRIVDTSLLSPGDFSERGLPLQQALYQVAPDPLLFWFELKQKGHSFGSSLTEQNH